METFISILKISLLFSVIIGVLFGGVITFVYVLWLYDNDESEPDNRIDFYKDEIFIYED